MMSVVYLLGREDVGRNETIMSFILTPNSKFLHLHEWNHNVIYTNPNSKFLHLLNDDLHLLNDVSCRSTLSFCTC